MFVKRSLFAVVLPLLLVGMLLAACGNNANTTTATSPTATTAPTAAPAPPVVMTASATVGGKAVTVLTTTQGMTLYYFTPDSSTTAACTSTGGCTTNWPPLLYAGTGTPNGPATLPGRLAATTCTNGNQVQYQNHFLYTFAGDKKPGDMNGQGLAGGKWQVATSDLTPLSNPSGGGYGGGNYGY